MGPKAVAELEEGIRHNLLVPILVMLQMSQELEPVHCYFV